jgi:tetratricopeptide (TPR) repeat protein
MPVEQSGEPSRELHSLHHRDALERIEAVLRAPGPSPVLLLSGVLGSNRTGLLQEALRGVGGEEDAVLPLDLEGYEEGEDSLARFAAHRLSLRRDLDEAGREALRERLAPLVSRLEPSLPGAAVVALLLAAGGAGEVPVEILAEASGAGEVLSRLLAHLARDRRVIVHARSEQLTDTLRRRLLDAAGRTPGLVVALSCFPLDPDDQVAPRAERLRLDLAPLPGAADRLQPLQDRLADLDLQAADRLQRFLDLAALCGENVPADLLVHHLELDEGQREELLDLIDEELVEGADHPLFHDFQYGHPSFPGILTYGFLSPSLARGLLEPVPEEKRKTLASELLDFILRSAPLQTRGMALLLLAIADHTGDPEVRHPFLLELRWRIGESETGELADEIAAELAAGRIVPEGLVRLARETREGWPLHRRQALLEAASRDADLLPPGARTELQVVRAEILRDSGKSEEAVEEGRRALEAARATHGPEAPEVVQALNLYGVLLKDAGRTSEAREHLERALATAASRQTDGPEAAALRANLAAVLRDLGEREAARDHLEAALALHRHAFGDVHPTVATHLGNLAVLSRELGDNERAFHYLRPVVNIVRQLYGDAHPQTARALTNVASALRDLGEMEGARLHLEAALSINRQVFGDHHPAVAADLNNLSVIERESGNVEAARRHLEEAATAAAESLGQDHPLTAQLRRSLAEE